MSRPSRFARPHRRAGLAHSASPSAAGRRARHRPGRPARGSRGSRNSTPPTTGPPSGLAARRHRPPRRRARTFAVLPGIPPRLGDHPVWGNYRAARCDLVRTLADQVKATVADTDPPAWGTRRGTVLPGSVIRDVQVWGRDAGRPGGPAPDRRRATPKAARIWQQHLDRQGPAIGHQPWRNGAGCSTNSTPT